MNRFAELLDRIAYEPGRNNKIKLIADYFRTTPDPSRGYALAAFTGALSFKYAKPALLRGLISDRVDQELFALSYDYIGDLSETIALLWPAKKIKGRNDVPTLSEIVETLGALGKLELPGQLVRWLDALDERGRWALLKLVTGGMRIGVSARLAKTAAAALGPHDVTEVELAWPGLEPPYEKLFAWLEGEGEAPESNNPVLFRPVMLAHAIEASDFGKLDPKEFVAEWKWDGIRMQAASGLDKSGKRATRLYSRTGEEITKSFPDLLSAFQHDGVLDGELLILREGRVQSFNVLQQRLNRKAVSSKLLQEFPAHIRAYDLLSEDGEDLRHLPFLERRKRLGKFVKNLKDSRVDLSPMVSFGSWDELAGARADPAQHGAGQDADAVEGVMIKRGDSVYQPGRPKGQWWKWKRDPKVIDAVLMYAQRGHGKRSSFYSDYTFGVWTNGDEGEQLVPVGKAYFGFTDEELQQIDRFVRRHTVNKFGPVREVVHEPNEGLVFEVAFEGLARSSRHKSGVAMRFPRISRLRWDKPPKEADRIEALEKLLEGDAAAPPKRKRRA
ncbi:MAG: cisplatin damage response ATP-dependent DNA ligase [Xanthobacteraceae bacterium]|nr:cisplatin damage response ATP-dependent DNA ligase [Xanthobacteraceae bacterium]